MNRKINDVLIETGKPLPEPRKRRGKWIVVARQMQIGDSVFFSKPLQARAMYCALTRCGMRASHRLEDGGIRIYRMPDDHVSEYPRKKHLTLGAQSGHKAGNRKTRSKKST